MLYGICTKSLVKVLYFIFIFISSSIPRFSMKKSVNQLIKIKGLISDIYLLALHSTVNMGYSIRHGHDYCKPI